MADDKELTNDQIADSIRQVTSMNLGSEAAVNQAITYQILTQAVGLAMHNAVAQQQHNYMLRNALVTAVAKALLETNPSEAIKLVDVAFGNDDIEGVLERLHGLMERVEAKHEARSRPTKTAKERPRRAAGKKK